MKLLGKIEKTKDCWFLIGVALIFFLLRFPSLFEPYWYGDEGIYHVIGSAINNGRLLYKDIWDNKPPLLYITYALFQSDQFFVRAASLISGLLALISFHLLAKHLVKGSEKLLFLTTAIFGFFFAIPFIEGNIANAENFMLFPIILAGLLIYTITEPNLYDKKLSLGIFHLSSFIFRLLIAGFLLSIAFLFKVVAVFDTAAFTIFLLFYYKNNKIDIKTIAIKIAPLVGGFLLPVILTSLYFIFHGAFFNLIAATLRQNVGYVGYGNTLFIPQGFLIFKLILLFGFCYVLFIKRYFFSKQHIFVLLWFAFSLFNAFFSGRPYTHYVLVLLPSLCLLFSITISEKIKRQKVLFTILFIITIIILSRNFYFYQKVIPYYTNYVSFILNKKSISSYQTFFDAKTPRDYLLARYINTHLKKNEDVFIWGNNAQLYTLINKLPPGRFIVAYHMTSSKETLDETRMAFEKNKPKYIVTSEKQPFPFNLSYYTKRIDIFGAIIYELTF